MTRGASSRSNSIGVLLHQGHEQPFERLDAEVFDRERLAHERGDLAGLRLALGVGVLTHEHDPREVAEVLVLHPGEAVDPVSYTHLRAHETDSYLVCRLLLE